jgi:hypothetical protein
MNIDNLTVKLNNGRIVLAKLYKGHPSAITYVNRTQAGRKARELGEGWAVFGFRPFYVGLVAAGEAVAA